MFENAGLLAGAVWTALNENGAQNAKDLKKAAKIKTDKELYLALGWLLVRTSSSFLATRRIPPSLSSNL